MFASDTNRGGVAKSWTMALIIHLLVLLLIIFYQNRQRARLVEYTLTEITMIQEIPDEPRPAQIQKPKTIIDMLKNIIPIKQNVSIEKIKPKALELEKPKIEIPRVKAIDMSKMESSIKPAVKEIDLNNEIGKAKISPAMAKVQIAIQQQQLAGVPSKINMSNMPGRVSSFLPAAVPANNTLAIKGPIVATGLKIGKPVPETQKQALQQKILIQKKQALMLTGLIAGRQIINTAKPDYPKYLRDQGIEAEVIVFFAVRSDGTVKNDARVERSSNYPELDRNAIDAIKQFQFVAIATSEDQTGYATFRYMLE